MSPSIRRMLITAALALLTPLAAHAGLLALNNLYVFGDSLSDGGNYAGPLTPANPDGFPPAPYAGTRYSNGPTAVENLWQAYHPGDTSFKPSNDGGTNYALGGATTGTGNFNGINPNVPTELRTWFADQGGVANQVASFAGSCNGCFVPDESLFVVWAFPNDVFSNAVLASQGLGVTGGELIHAGVNNIMLAIQALIGEGATDFLVPNMPDLGKTAGYLGNTDLSQLTAAFNFALATALTALDQAMSGVEITQFDTSAALNNIIANRTQFGMSNVTGACVDHLQDGTCNPATWLFWDGVHPTAAGHAILGAEFAAAIDVPEPSSLWLLALALLLLTLRWHVKPARRSDAQPGVFRAQGIRLA